MLIEAASMGVAQLGAVLSYGALVAPLQRAWQDAVTAEPARLAMRFGAPVQAVESAGGEVRVRVQGEPAAADEWARLKKVSEIAGDLSDPRSDGGQVGLPYLVERVLARCPGSQRLLLLVDQWEELYTYRETDAATAAAFADRLIEASARAPLRIVLTLRADFT
ncbi:MAG: hypothetical protein JNL98_44720, partial [Bryobacterales bacterium]|nr:hypothetical protein [Bryobacterales bacterium]